MLSDPARRRKYDAMRALQHDGWTNDSNVNKMLDLMAARGEVATSGRRGNERLWDLGCPSLVPHRPPESHLHGAHR